MGDEYGDSERQALRGLFDIYDKDGSGFVNEDELAIIMEKVGRDPSQAKQLLNEVDPDHNGKVTFEEFIKILSLGREQPEDADADAVADKKVVEFLRILNEYRMKCEEEGKYLEAERASQQLATLQGQEKKRQKRQFRAKQIAERQDVQIAHNMQFAEFNQSWDKYMEEYDQMAQLYIQQMTEKHAKQLKDHQEMIIQKVMSQPPKFTRELLDWRRRQHLLAKRKNYAEAQKIKRLTDQLEEKEMRKIAEQRKNTIKKLEAQFRREQQKELTALLKRIDGRRKEHIKQRNEDSKRLLQRNKNVQNVLESKQTVQLQKQQEAIQGALRVKQQKHRSKSDIPGNGGGGGGKTFVTEEEAAEAAEADEDR
jgi:hypothetical protein